LCWIKSYSSVYETKPFGEVTQENFFNAVIKISTGLDIISLLQFLKSTEKSVGRTESVRWGPREIDIDLLYFDDVVYNDEKINVPHPGIRHRDFVIVPLNEIAPDFIHPALKKKNSDICIEISESYIVGKLTDILIINKA
jgi:2-amino-4-hydroxy-6-hydroxymethyldihydropteridine diphosphokinase